MADDNVETSAPIATVDVAEEGRPEYVQEKFWDSNANKVNLENLSSSYNSLEQKLGARTEDLTKQIREDISNEVSANVPEEYKINLPELPENSNIQVSKDMDIVKWWDKTAKASGLSQSQYDEGVNAFINNAMSNVPNPDAELLKLGDTGKERVEAASLWSKKNLTPDSYNTIAQLASNAEGVKAIEELMALSKDTPMPHSPTQIDLGASADDLKGMLNDPRYWDSSRRDPAYVRRVTELYEKAHAKTPQV